jgi:hypothetical protein
MNKPACLMVFLGAPNTRNGRSRSLPVAAGDSGGSIRARRSGQNAAFTPDLARARPMIPNHQAGFRLPAVSGHIATGESGGRIGCLALAAVRAGN